MLQEMNHRVRNNLQTVAGLLSMQLRRMPTDSKAATAVKESIARIQSMATVHDLMMNAEAGVESTNLFDLARKVADAAASTLNRPDFNLKITVDPEEAERIKVGSHEATLLALLLNELISNAILHGFEGRDKGEIKVKAWLNEPQDTSDYTLVGPTLGRKIAVEVADDGVGLPRRFDVRKDANLGLNIVNSLVVNDLRGEFQIGPGPGGKGTVARFSLMPSAWAG
jgi:two-component sensor histidine kinase